MSTILAALAIAAALAAAIWGVCVALTPSGGPGRHIASTPPTPPPPVSTSAALTPPPPTRPITLPTVNQPPAAPPPTNGTDTPTGELDTRSAMVRLDALGPWEPPTQPDLMVPPALCPPTPAGWLTNTGVHKLVDFPEWDRDRTPDDMVSGGTCS